MSERCEITGKFKPVEMLIGATYYEWTVLELSHKDPKSGNVFWKCECSCGNIRRVAGHRILRGESKRCNAPKHKRDDPVNVTHGMRYTKIYACWRNIKIRCLNPTSQNFYLYGGRGISICDRWVDSFENFYEDMKDGHDDSKSIERIDVDGNYCKENCRWATKPEQAKNKRNTAYLTYKGVTKRAADWAAAIGANPRTVVRRVYLGYSPDECLFGKQYEQIKRLILAESLIDYKI